MQVFVDNPLLTLFFCVGVGTAFGMIRFGPVSFGPAGALFAGLALSALNADVALGPVYSSIGLCVFCYMVGLAAGPSFMRAIRTSYQPLIVAGTAIVAMAASGLAVGRALGVDTSYIAGAYSGAATATPAGEQISALTSTRWAFDGLVRISGIGEDVISDPCWQLSKAERDDLSQEDKEAMGCRCTGTQMFDACYFPGIRSSDFYDEDTRAKLAAEEPVKPPTPTPYPTFTPYPTLTPPPTPSCPHRPSAARMPGS